MARLDNIILLIFEGEKTEPQIFNNLKGHFFPAKKSNMVYATYNADIYQLWKQVEDDEFLDLLELLRERNKRNENILEGIEQDRIAQTFLFFDYDGHATNASDEDIQKMLEHFDEETENGKLYVSYPMVEALKHLTSDFRTHTVPEKENIHYKDLVDKSRSPYQDLRKINAEGWKYIISENLKKGNHIVNGQYILPESASSQPDIFEGQLTKYIRPSDHVAVLSGIPFFIVEYFGLSAILNP